MGQWNGWARRDPLYGILTADEKRGRRWELEEFMATGRRDVDDVLARIHGLGLGFQTNDALDFGCGVGRLTQALAETFTRVVGVDATAEYIRLARTLNRDPDRVSFQVSGGTLPFPDDQFDLVLSLATLQHITPDKQLRYIAEFVRVARPGGLLAFQSFGSPTALASRIGMAFRPLFILYQLIRLRGHRMDLYPLEPTRIFREVEGARATIHDMTRMDHRARFASNLFVAQKSAKSRATHR